MHRLVLTGLLSVMFALLSFSSVAGDDGSPPSLISEDEFLSALDIQHPAVLDKAQAIGLAEAGVVAATTWQNPTLGLARENPSGPQSLTEWTLSWQLPEASRRLQRQARKGQLDAARARFDFDLVALRSLWKEAYAQWAVAAQRRQQLVTRSQQLEALLEQQLARADKGEASGLDARRLRLATADSKARFELLQADLEAARAEISAWYPDLPAHAEPQLPPLPPPSSLESDHALLRAGRSEVAAAELERRIAQRLITTPELTLGWQRQEDGNQSADGVLLGVAWSIPFFDRKRAEQAVATAQLTAARGRLEMTERQIASRRTAALAAYERLRNATAAAEQELVDNGSMLQAAGTAFRYGESDLTDLLDIQRAVTDSESTWLDLYQAALAAHRRLQQLGDSRLGDMERATTLPLEPSEETSP